MRVTAVFFALLGFLMLVAVVPVWSYWINATVSDLPDYVQFLATLSLPATLALFIGSWIQPR